MSSSTSVRSAAASYAGQTGALAPLGSDLGRVLLVIEYVEGGTLRRWSAPAPRPWREVVRMLLDSGEGPGAAHVAGMVHRDFKPENVLPGAETLDTRTLQVLEAPSAHDDRSLAEALELAGECALDHGDAARARTLFARSQTQRNFSRTQLALIKLAAAGVKVREGQPHGIETHARRAQALIQGLRQAVGPRWLGIELGPLEEFARSVADHPVVHPERSDLAVLRVFDFPIQGSGWVKSAEP